MSSSIWCYSLFEYHMLVFSKKHKTLLLQNLSVEMFIFTSFFFFYKEIYSLNIGLNGKTFKFIIEAMFL